MSKDNQINAVKISGTSKKSGKQWQGLAVQATVDNVLYSGVVFPKRNDAFEDSNRLVSFK